jgi:hypothetical protein
MIVHTCICVTLLRIKTLKSVFWIILQNFYCMDLLDILCTVALPLHCGPIGTSKIGVYDVIGELFVIEH